MNKHGLSLVSTMVAIALSSIVAVAAGKLITNQTALAKIEELHDRRQAILKFYTDMLKNEAIVKCTLEGNSSLNEHVKKYQTSSGVSSAALIPPSCSGSLIPSGGMYLGESISIAKSDGWWKISFGWEGKGKGAVDFVVDICFDRDKHKAAYPSYDVPPLKHECPSKKSVRVRYSENSVQAGDKDCVNKAVVDIALHTVNRQVTCSVHPLVDISTTCTTFIENIDDKGKIECSDPTDRTGSDPSGISAPSDRGINGFQATPNISQMLQPTEGKFMEFNQHCAGGKVVAAIDPPKLSCGKNMGFTGMRGDDAPCPVGENCVCPQPPPGATSGHKCGCTRQTTGTNKGKCTGGCTIGTTCTGT